MPNSPDNSKILDLSYIAGQETPYMCDLCGDELLPYPQAQIDNPFARGPCFICPSCHQVLDASLIDIPHIDDIQPILMGNPSIEFMNEEKGLSRKSYDQDNVKDPEPQEEELLKQIGATIISKKVEAKNDFA